MGAEDNVPKQRSVAEDDIAEQRSVHWSDETNEQQNATEELPDKIPRAETSAQCGKSNVTQAARSLRPNRERNYRH
jgi:hypothetical protein